MNAPGDRDGEPAGTVPRGGGLAGRNAAVLGVTAALCAFPVFADLLFSWRHAPFRYFTSDTYYYLDIARNVAERGLWSFDGERPTNGFHPLWQALLALLYKCCLVLDLSELSFCYLVVIVATGLATLAVTILGWTIIRARGALPVSFALLPVGLYALLLAPVWFTVQEVVGNVSPTEGPFPLYGTIWSYVNGMESSLALFSFALLGLLVTRAARASVAFAALLGLAGAFAVLSRLDQVFIAGSVLVFVACRWTDSDRGRSARRVLAMGAGFAVPIGLYLLVNLLYSGLAFPVSGASKLSLGNFGRSNLESILLVLRSTVAARFWLDRFFRLAQLLVPAAAAAVSLAASVRLVRAPRGWRLEARSRDEFGLFVAATAPGVLALCGTVFLFSNAAAYGSWSLPVPVLFVSLAALSLLPPRAPAGAHPELRLAGAVCVVLAAFWTLHRQPDYHEKYRRSYMGREKVVGFYGAVKPRLIEVDDGIVGFATHFPTLSGLNYASDRELHAAILGGRLLDVAKKRGYDRIASLVYLPGGANRESALSFLASTYRDGTGSARYTLEYFDPSLPFAIARISYPPTPASP